MTGHVVSLRGYDLFFAVATLNYAYKMLAAVLMIPALYAMRKLIHRYLGHEQAELLRQQAHSNHRSIRIFGVWKGNRMVAVMHQA